MTNASQNSAQRHAVEHGDGGDLADTQTVTELGRTKRVLIWIYLAGVFFFLSALLAYLVGFNGQRFVAKADAWGQFGDFIGGVTNPLVGLLGLAGLLWTIYQNQRELLLTRKELRNSSRALLQSNQIATAQATQFAIEEEKDDILRLIGIIIEDIRHELDKEGAFEGIAQAQELKVYNSVRVALGYDFYQKSLAHVIGLLSNPKYQAVESGLEDLLRDRVGKVSEMLVQLKDSLSRFDALAPNNVVLAYYSRRFLPVIEVLAKLNAIDASTKSFYTSHLTLRPRNMKSS